MVFREHFFLLCDDISYIKEADGGHMGKNSKSMLVIDENDVGLRKIDLSPSEDGISCYKILLAKLYKKNTILNKPWECQQKGVVKQCMMGI